MLKGKRNPEHWSIKRQPLSLQLCPSTWQPSIHQGFSYARIWDLERRVWLSLWLPSESELWQIDCEQLACKSFHSEGLCSRPAAYTLRLQRLRDAQLSGGTILGRVSADAQQDWCLALCLIAPLASAFFHFPTVLSTKFSSSLPFSVLLPARWDGSGPHLHPSLPEYIFPSCHISVLMWLSLGGRLLDEGSDVFCQGMSFFLSVWFSFFFCPYSSSFHFLHAPFLTWLSASLSSSPPSFSVACGCFSTGTIFTSRWHPSPLLLFITSIFSLCLFHHV